MSDSDFSIWKHKFMLCFRSVRRVNLNPNCPSSWCYWLSPYSKRGFLYFNNNYKGSNIRKVRKVYEECDGIRLYRMQIISIRCPHLQPEYEEIFQIN
jgi:hypothetical protein